MDLQLERVEMVKKQIESRGITSDAILSAMALVPRERFVPEDFIQFSYFDRPLPIDCAQSISQPYIIAYMAEVLNLKPTDRVLEIGTGTGYNAAVLSEIVSQVYSIEIIPALAREARSRLWAMGYPNIRIKNSDGSLGWPEQAPFDAIVLTAATEVVPEALFEQLAEGGRMIAPVGGEHQNLYLFTKNMGKIDKVLLMPVRFLPLVDEEFLIKQEIIRKPKNWARH